MEARLFDPSDVPDFTTPEWYSTRDRAPHLEEWVHWWRLGQARDLIERAVKEFDASSVCDYGAGDGGLISTMKDWPVTTWGYDLQPTNIEGAKERGVDVILQDVITDPPAVFTDVAVATEMIEHLEDPHGFVRMLAPRCRFLVASSPVNETADSHYAFHLWAWDRDGYASLVEQGGFQVVQHVDNGQFQVLLAQRVQS